MRIEKQKRSDQKMSNNNIKEIPSLGSWFRLPNLLRLKNSGKCFVNELLKDQDSSVIKVNLSEPTILLCDYDSVKYSYDPRYVMKEPYFGKSFNPALLGGRLPAMYSNGEDHKVKKQVALEILNHGIENLSLGDMSEVIKSELEAINIEKGDTFEHQIEQVSRSIITKILLGKVLHDSESWREWFEKCLDIKFLRFLTFGEDRVLEENLKSISQTPTVKNLHKIVPESTLLKEEQILELLHNTNFNGTPALSWVMLSIIARFNDSLSDGERKAIAAEAEEFLRLDPALYDDKALAKLDLTEAFLLEVFRYNAPHLLGSYGRAVKDFVIESKTGKYQVYAGELLTGFVHHVHRDGDVFDEPCKFKLNRDRETARNKHLAFAGLAETEPTAENRKCPGQGILMKALKIFIAHFTRCTIDFKSDITYTGKTATRMAGTDDPIVLKKFVYNKIV